MMETKTLKTKNKVSVAEFDNDGEDFAPGLHAFGAGGSDFTLCGVNLDGDGMTSGTWHGSLSSKITCPECVAIIKFCKALPV